MMAKSQKIILETALTDGSRVTTPFTVPGGHDGKHGLTRDTTILKFDLNQPDAATPNACGRLQNPNAGLIGGMYVRMRDYLPFDTLDGFVVQYSLIDIPLWLGRSSIYELDHTPPMMEEDTGKIYCDVQLSGYYIFTQYIPMGSITAMTTYRPEGDSGAETAGIAISSNEEDLNCMRFYRSVLY